MSTDASASERGPLAAPRPDIGWRGLRAESRELAWIYSLMPVLLTALWLALYASVRARWPFLLAFFASITVITCFAQSALFTLVLGRLAPHAQSGWVWPLRIVAVAAGMALGVDLSVRLFGALGLVDDTWAQRMQILPVGAVICIAITAISAAFDRLHARRHAAEHREEALRRKALQAQLTALQARTNPHFLFNALNTVASLIEDDPVAAEGAVERLSDLFRYALDGSGRRLVDLDDELRAVDDYLSIERLRFGDRLRVDVDIEPRCRELRIPPLTLQPLVENAMRHGVAARRRGGRIRVTAAVAPLAPGQPAGGAGALVLTVDDDGPGPGQSANRAGSGTALAELRERLRLSYEGDTAVLETGRSPAGGFRARVVLPCVLRDGARATTAGEDPW